MGLRRVSLKIYWALRRVIAPKLTYAQYLYEETLKARVRSESRWLDLGCGHGILPVWRRAEEVALVRTCAFTAGLDYDHASLLAHRTITRRVRGDISQLPFCDGSFDLVTMNMVVEHLLHPERQLEEVRRILAPGGLLVFHTPNSFGYTTMMARLVPKRLKGLLISLLDGRTPSDVFPTYYRANTRSRIKELAHSNGYEVVSVRMVVTDAAFAVISPVAVLELIWLRLLMTDALKGLRTNIIAVLRKAETQESPRG